MLLPNNYYICTVKQTNIRKIMVTKISMRATLAGMKPGEVITIPMKMRAYNSVRNCASLLGVDYPGRKYSVSADREKQQSKVTRVQ